MVPEVILLFKYSGVSIFNIEYVQHIIKIIKTQWL